MKYVKRIFLEFFWAFHSAAISAENPKLKRFLVIYGWEREMAGQRVFQRVRVPQISLEIWELEFLHFGLNCSCFVQMHFWFQGRFVGMKQ